MATPLPSWIIAPFDDAKIIMVMVKTTTEMKHKDATNVEWNVAHLLILTCCTTDVLQMLLLEGKNLLRC